MRWPGLCQLHVQPEGQYGLLFQTGRRTAARILRRRCSTSQTRPGLAALPVPAVQRQEHRVHRAELKRHLHCHSRRQHRTISNHIEHRGEQSDEDFPLRSAECQVHLLQQWLLAHRSLRSGWPRAHQSHRLGHSIHPPRKGPSTSRAAANWLWRAVSQVFPDWKQCVGVQRAWEYPVLAHQERAPAGQAGGAEPLGAQQHLPVPGLGVFVLLGQLGHWCEYEEGVRGQWPRHGVPGQLQVGHTRGGLQVPQLGYYCYQVQPGIGRYRQSGSIPQGLALWLLGILHRGQALRCSQ